MTMMMMMMTRIIMAVLTLLPGVSHAYYIPGTSPRSFRERDDVKLKVNSLSSTKTLLPIDYYSLPFCQPATGEVQRESENLGEFLAGDRIETSAYTLQMKTDMHCEQVCSQNVGHAQHAGHMKPTRLQKAILNQYHNNWMVDHLPSASKSEDEKLIMTEYAQGFPIGYVNQTSGIAYLHNHVNLEVMYHEHSPGNYRVVRFTVEPFSIKHDFEVLPAESASSIEPGSILPRIAKISNPIASCDPLAPLVDGKRPHTDFDMVTSRDPQPAAGPVLFTYDVIWKENKEVRWASRWDIYLTTNNTPARVHWLEIGNSLVVVAVLTLMIATILVRNLRRDIIRYNKLATDEEKAEELEEYGWKLVHGDVFRPPTTSPMLLAIFCGTGAQLMAMALSTIFFAAIGFMSPARRGRLTTVALLLYVLMGVLNGYVTARLYKTLKGKAWQMASTLTAVALPGVAFGTFGIMNLVALSQKSTDAVPFATMLELILLWFGITIPLVFVGAYFGYQADAIEFPVDIASRDPRPIPSYPVYVYLPCALFFSGILPFASCFVELYYIFSSVWSDCYYYVFGFLLLVFVLLIITCAEITILLTYYQLCLEDYRWWWASFLPAGSTALWVFWYSINYFRQLDPSQSLATYVLYFGYMSLSCLGIFLMLGFVGVSTSLYFNKVIFASIKID